MLYQRKEKVVFLSVAKTSFFLLSYLAMQTITTKAQLLQRKNFNKKKLDTLRKKKVENIVQMKKKIQELQRKIHKKHAS